MQVDLKLALIPDMTELSKDIPIAGFSHTVATLVRAVVQIQKDELARRRIPLRIRLEPPHDQLDRKGQPVAPTRLVVRDGDVHFRIPISVGVNSVVIGDTLAVTSNGDPATKVASAIAKEVAKKLGLAREQAVDAHRTAQLGGE